MVLYGVVETHVGILEIQQDLKLIHILRSFSEYLKVFAFVLIISVVSQKEDEGVRAQKEKKFR